MDIAEASSRTYCLQREKFLLPWHGAWEMLNHIQIFRGLFKDNGADTQFSNEAIYTQSHPTHPETETQQRKLSSSATWTNRPLSPNEPLSEKTSLCAPRYKKKR
jgi:hypothetical protein